VLPIDIEWATVIEEGETQVTLRCLTPEVNFDGLMLLVEERISSGQVIESRQSIDIVQRVLRLPDEYFAKLDECEETQNKIFKEINDRYVIQAVPIPGYDPGLYNAREYVNEVARQFPEFVNQIASDVLAQPRVVTSVQTRISRARNINRMPC
jgi:hypothetical protein